MYTAVYDDVFVLKLVDLCGVAEKRKLFIEHLVP